jgi:hypothetical protein
MAHHEKKFSYILLFTVMLLAASSLMFAKASFAESIFLSGGSIIEGKIINENDRMITIGLIDKRTQDIERKNILRIIYNEDYKKRVYIQKMDDSIIEGYVVDETQDSYIIRNDLISAYETKIPKSDVNGILKSKEGFKAVPAKAGSSKKGEKSVGLAVFTSIFPIWSGSWNVKFTGGGLTYVLLKSATLGVLGWSSWYFFVHHNNDTFIEYLLSYNELGIMVVAVEALAYLGFFAGDAILSATTVKNYNMNLIGSNEYINTEVRYALKPHVGSITYNRIEYTVPDGIDLCVRYSF